MFRGISAGWIVVPPHCRPSQAFAPTTGDAQDQQTRSLFGQGASSSSRLEVTPSPVPGAHACVARRPASGTPVASSQPRSLITARRERPRNRPPLLSQPLRRPTNPAIPHHSRAGLSFSSVWTPFLEDARLLSPTHGLSADLGSLVAGASCLHHPGVVSGSHAAGGRVWAEGSRTPRPQAGLLSTRERWIQRGQWGQEAAPDG
jgi:hypothetical protein